MAKFYFHLRDHTEELLDPEGVDCPNADAVAMLTMKTARDLISGDAQNGKIDLSFRIDVEDTSDRIVHSLQFEDAVSIKRAA